MMLAGGYFATCGTDPSIKIRIKDEYDGAEPTASSVAAASLIRLGALLPGPAKGGASEQAEAGSDFALKAEKTLAG